MKRLTYKDGRGRNTLLINGQEYHGPIADRLAALEEAEAEGRLLLLPCKFGDTVYVLRWNTDACNSCDRKGWDSNGLDDYEICLDDFNTWPYYLESPSEVCPKFYREIVERAFDENFIKGDGKAVFSTRKEAEAALRKEQGE